MHLNPRSGRWLPDASHLQRHVNAAISYNVWHYHQATGDGEFLRFYGAEMLIEIARFWASIATYSRSLDRYSIRGVMGPDEYHEGYPGREEPGLDDNTYTNVMAVWCLARAIEVLEVLPPAAAMELRDRLDVTDEEVARWEDVSTRMRVCFHDAPDGSGPILSQFDGFESDNAVTFAQYVKIRSTSLVSNGATSLPNPSTFASSLPGAGISSSVVPRIEYACEVPDGEFSRQRAMYSGVAYARLYSFVPLYSTSRISRKSVGSSVYLVVQASAATVSCSTQRSRRLNSASARSMNRSIVVAGTLLRCAHSAIAAFSSE